MEEHEEVVLEFGDTAAAGGNVFGLMPHPEHAVEEALGGRDGLAILGSLVDGVGPR